MSIFSRGGDVIDLPEMQRRCLVKFPEKEEEIDEIDFTAKKDEISEQKNENIVKKETPMNDFFGSFAAIGVSNNAVEKKEEKPEIKGELNTYDLKWRLENTEYKIEQILERLIAIEKKIL